MTDTTPAPFRPRGAASRSTALLSLARDLSLGPMRDRCRGRLPKAEELPWAPAGRDPPARRHSPASQAGLVAGGCPRMLRHVRGPEYTRSAASGAAGAGPHEVDVASTKLVELESPFACGERRKFLVAHVLGVPPELLVLDGVLPVAGPCRIRAQERLDAGQDGGRQSADADESRRQLLKRSGASDGAGNNRRRAKARGSLTKCLPPNGSSAGRPLGVTTPRRAHLEGVRMQIHQAPQCRAHQVPRLGLLRGFDVKADVGRSFEHLSVSLTPCCDAFRGVDSVDLGFGPPGNFDQNREHDFGHVGRSVRERSDIPPYCDVPGGPQDPREATR
jgi:hypothetical protein